MYECISTLTKSWTAIAQVSFKELAFNLLLAKFDSKEGMTKIIEAGPWSYLGDLVMSEAWKQGMNLKQIEFKKIELWLQIHNLPIELVKSNMAKEFAGYAGTVLKEFNYKGSVIKRKYARFRIEVNLKKSLCTGFYLDPEEGESIWIEFMYERIHYCSKRGDLIHDLMWCKQQENEFTKTSDEPTPGQLPSLPKAKETIDGEDNSGARQVTGADEPQCRRAEEDEEPYVPTSLGKLATQGILQ